MCCYTIEKEYYCEVWFLKCNSESRKALKRKARCSSSTLHRHDRCIENKSTQRVYNTFEKGQTPPILSPSSSSSSFITFFPFQQKTKLEFCLVSPPGLLRALPSISPPLISFRFMFYLLSSFCAFHLCYYNLAGNCTCDDRERTSSVPCKSRH